MILDDLKPGDFITVLRGPLEEKLIPLFDDVKRVQWENTEFNGIPLQVLGVELPYIAVVLLVNGPPFGTTTIDTRRTKIRGISAEYAGAYLRIPTIAGGQNSHDGPENTGNSAANPVS